MASSVTEQDVVKVTPNISPSLQVHFVVLNYNELNELGCPFNAIAPCNTWLNFDFN